MTVAAVVWAGAPLALLVWREVLTSVSHSSLGLWVGWLGSLVGGITAASARLGLPLQSLCSTLPHCVCLLAETSRRHL